MTRPRDPLIVGRVIGDVLNPFTNSISMRISYYGKNVINGSEFKPSQIVTQPRVDIGGDDFRTFYTLIMVDPDAPNPSNPSLKEYLQWLVTDIPATTGAAFATYRNLILTIEMKCFATRALNQAWGSITLCSSSSGNSGGKPCMHGWRQSFNTRDFAEIYNLGSPVSAIYFNCQSETGRGGRRRSSFT